MAITDPKNTLAHHQSRVLTTHRDMSEVKCAVIAKAVSAYMKADVKPDTKPETEALWFYGMNHGMALISAKYAPLQPLPPMELEFVRAYHEVLGPKAVRAFYYLLWICTREARHNGSLVKDTPKITELFGPEVGAFYSSINGGEAGISKAFLTNPPDCSIGVYVKSLAWMFYKSSWSTGYGGKKWGDVTDCLVRFVTGEFTAEMMLDTVWTLAHNGGAIFNKGSFYTCHTPVLARLLDIQRSGQIPEAIGSDAPLAKFSDVGLCAQMATVFMLFESKLGKFVDWVMVEALGSVEKYPSEKKKQLGIAALTPAGKAAQAKAEAAALVKALAVAKAEAKAIADHDKIWFKVMEGFEVQKIKIARAA
jgi:hypothetical protein